MRVTLAPYRLLWGTLGPALNMSEKGGQTSCRISATRFSASFLVSKQVPPRRRARKHARRYQYTHQRMYPKSTRFCHVWAIACLTTTCIFRYYSLLCKGSARLCWLLHDSLQILFRRICPPVKLDRRGIPQTVTYLRKHCLNLQEIIKRRYTVRPVCPEINKVIFPIQSLYGSKPRNTRLDLQFISQKTQDLVRSKSHVQFKSVSRPIDLSLCIVSYGTRPPQESILLGNVHNLTLRNTEAIHHQRRKQGIGMRKQISWQFSQWQTSQSTVNAILQDSEFSQALKSKETTHFESLMVCVMRPKVFGNEIPVQGLLNRLWQLALGHDNSEQQ